MWKYIKPFLPYAILAGLFMVGEVAMDLLQPGIMRQIVDDGVLGLDHGGSLVSRVTNDITQMQNFVSQFVRGMIRTSMLMFGSMYCMFRLNHTFGLVVLCAFPLTVGCLAICIAKANPLFT